MKQRTLTAIIFLAILIPSIIIGGTLFEILMISISLLSMNEILIMRKRMLISLEAILAYFSVIVSTLTFNIFSGRIDNYIISILILYLMFALSTFKKENLTISDISIIFMSSVYIGFGFKNIILAREYGLEVIMFGFLIIWTTDTFAYIIGKKIGKNNFMKNISPNKTLEGSVGGTLVAVVLASLYIKYFNFYPNDYSFLSMVIISFVLSIVNQIGDLFESNLKRFHNVKDSGRFLPGHGGFLDRFDSSLLVFPTMYLLYIF